MFEHVDEGCQCEGKVCSKCNTVKCLVAYHTDKRTSDGRVVTCKDCVNARKRQQRQENIEKSKAYHREYNRLHAEELKAKRNLWYQQNAEQRAKKLLIIENMQSKLKGFVKFIKRLMLRK